MIKFSIVITTYNRVEDLKITLNTLDETLERNDVELIICDDASTDNTVIFLKENYSHHTLIFNKKGKGLIHNRNVLNNKAKGEYIISLDDDLNFLSENPLETIDLFFKNNPKAAILSFRIFWGISAPNNYSTNQKTQRVNSFAGGSHVLRKSLWEQTPKYPEWFQFYGEEDFLAYHTFLLQKEIYYFPTILTHHRVDLKSRKNNKDYLLRLKRSIRSGWYLYLLFCPLKQIPKLFTYTIYMQIKKKELKIIFSLILAFIDLFLNIKNIQKSRCRFSTSKWKEYRILPSVTLYWSPKNNVI